MKFHIVVNEISFLRTYIVHVAKAKFPVNGIKSHLFSMDKIHPQTEVAYPKSVL